MSLSNEDVLQILALLDASGFDELRVETSDYKLHLRRSIPANEPPLASAAPSDPPLLPASLESAVTAPPPAPTEAIAASIPPEELHAITAPMLGTFYGAPQPGAPPFVSIGATVGHDTVIGIVEVMKLMNSICAGASGTVVEIVANDGDFVEFGDVLVRIAPAAT
jgi:acetyl-CoA carboxylase biotin carboxyl carrier protein